MRKMIIFLLAFLLCLTLLWACAPEPTSSTSPAYFCRVECVHDDGAILYISGFGNVYVKDLQTALEISKFDTIVLTFSESDLQAVKGTLPCSDEKGHSYGYLLESPQNVRLPDPSIGEPTFG